MSARQWLLREIPRGWIREACLVSNEAITTSDALITLGVVKSPMREIAWESCEIATGGLATMLPSLPFEDD